VAILILLFVELSVLDVLFQVTPVIVPNPEMNHQIAMWRNYTEINKAYAEAIAARYNKNDLGIVL
jgi:trehalose-6-phosphate synthase